MLNINKTLMINKTLSIY